VLAPLRHSTRSWHPEPVEGAPKGLARRDFSIKIKERILFAGFAMILMLMVTVIFNKVARIFRQGDRDSPGPGRAVSGILPAS